jgi:hypothetical protein
MRTCAHCGDPIPDGKRASARFCKASCRVNHHVASRPLPVLTDDVRLNRTEAGLLFDAAEPWAVHEAGRTPDQPHPVWGSWAHGRTPTPGAIEAWREWCGRQARAKRAQRAWRRLAALGLVRVGRLARSYGQTVIERTEVGTALLTRRHNELGAIAERGNGASAAGIVFWCDGGLTSADSA